jgi:hypothetical protein
MGVEPTWNDEVNKMRTVSCAVHIKYSNMLQLKLDLMLAETRKKCHIHGLCDLEPVA